jgi:putative SOS response-associated peptidase YedK
VAWSATFVATDARGPAGEVHDRTALILPGLRVDAWRPAQDRPRPAPGRARWHWVEPLELRVNNVRSDGARLLEPIGDESDRPLQLALA